MAIRKTSKKTFRYVLKDGLRVKVTDHLSTQFIVDGGEFLFYKDEGVTWKKVGYCYCAIGAGGRPCVSREYCDEHRQEVWEDESNRG